MRQLKITKSITNRESASLDKYLQEIGREELVTPDEEVELAQRIRKGSTKATWVLSRLPKNSTKPVASSSSPTPYGGSARASFRHLQSRAVSYVSL